MRKKKKHKEYPFSNLPVRKKFLLMDIMLIFSVLLVWTAMVRTISKTQKEKYKQMERTAITASEQIVDMSVESAVSIAKNIYTDESVYIFLNKQYSSSSEYYEAFYPLQRTTAMNLADTNIVKGCIIYTENPTVLTGGSIKKLESAKDEYWYKCFTKMNKPIILCVDPSDGTMSLIRKLDYLSLSTGESYIRLDINRSTINQFTDELGFDGQLHVMCGSTLLYSSDKDAESVDDISIGKDFDCITRNYYTVDIEFYSSSRKSGLREFLMKNKLILSGLLAFTGLAVLISYCLSTNVRRRALDAINEYQSTGGIASFSKGGSGRDEVGRLLDVCCDMSEKLQLTGSEFQMSSDSLMRKSSDYNSLFTTAMRLDAELTAALWLPDIWTDLPDEYYPLKVESELIQKLAKKYHAVFNGSVPTYDKTLVPAYCFVLIAKDVFERFSGESVNVSVAGDIATISFISSTPPKTADVLRLSAIFEDDSVTSAYSFDRKNNFNPYLRLKHCLGSHVDMEIYDKNRLKLTFIIKSSKEKGE